MPQKVSTAKRAQHSEVRRHQLGQEVFKSISANDSSEDDDK